MADEPTTTEAKPAKKPPVDLFKVFLSKSGYSADDVDVRRPAERVFGTTNGGKYQLLKNGSIRILKGPFYPKYVAPDEE